MDELNDLLTRIQEAGITDKWKTDIQKIETVYYEPLNPNTSKGLKAYSLNDLWFAFMFLFVGYIISMIALILEFVFKRIKKWNHMDISYQYNWLNTLMAHNYFN